MCPGRSGIMVQTAHKTHSKHALTYIASQRNHPHIAIGMPLLVLSHVCCAIIYMASTIQQRNYYALLQYKNARAAALSSPSEIAHMPAVHELHIHNSLIVGVCC
jgi:5,10-methenyltetrahydromethanopterin hydrogenase